MELLLSPSLPPAKQVVRELDPGPQGRARCGSRPAHASPLAARQEGPFPAISALCSACGLLLCPHLPKLGAGPGFFAPAVERHLVPHG